MRRLSPDPSPRPKESAKSVPEAQDTAVATRVGSMLKIVSAVIAGLGIALSSQHPDVKDYMHEVIHTDALSFSSKELSIDHLSACLAEVERKIETGEMKNATHQQKVHAAVFVKKSVLNPLKELARIERGGPDVQNNYQALPEHDKQEMEELVQRLVQVLKAIYSDSSDSEQLYAALSGSDDALLHSAKALGSSQATLDQIHVASENARIEFFEQISSDLGGLSIDAIIKMHPDDLAKECLATTGGNQLKIQEWLGRQIAVIYYYQQLHKTPTVIASSSEE